MSALHYLLSKEWSMGNGQCPECCGVPESWLGHPLYLTPEGIGHKHECTLAAAIKDAGGKPRMVGESTLTNRYESYIRPDGIFTTRLVSPSTTEPGKVG